MADYEKKYPEEAAEFKQLIGGDLPDDWDAVLPHFTPDDKVRFVVSFDHQSLLSTSKCDGSCRRVLYSDELHPNFMYQSMEVVASQPDSITGHLRS